MLIACLCVIVTTHIGAGLAPADTIASARLAYEREIDSITASVDLILRQRVESAAVNPGNEAALAAAQDALRVFHSSGTLPDVPARVAWTARYARAVERQRELYERAAQELDPDEDASRLMAQLETFESVWDLAPWQVHDAEWEEPDRLVTSDDADGLDVKLPAGVACRVDLVIRAVSGEGILEVMHPNADGSACRARTGVLGEEATRVSFFTGLNEMVHGAEFTNAESVEPIDAPPGLRLLAAEGDFRIDSLRVKPLGTGPAPQAEERRSPKRVQPRPVRNVRDPYAMRTQGIGKCLHHDRASNTMRAVVEVVQRENRGVAIQVVLSETGETFRVSGLVSGPELTITQVEQTRRPRNKPGFQVASVESGGGSVSDGKLSLWWLVRGSSRGGTTNRLWRVRVFDVDWPD